MKSEDPFLREVDAGQLIYRLTGQQLVGDALRDFALANFYQLASTLLTGAIAPATITQMGYSPATKTMLPASVLLLGEYTGQDVTGWLVSEKFDGVRALWDGHNLVSRNGNIFNAPRWFTDQLPADTALDGELHMGRGLFQQVPGAVRRKIPDDAEWLKITYRVFDAPQAVGGFASRLDAARAAVGSTSVATIVGHTQCSGADHLDALLADVVAQGGEGVVIRNPTAEYCLGTSADALKYKPVYSDEATVIGYNTGDRGWTRSLVCEWRGVYFNLSQGLTEPQRYAPSEIGEKVTFEYEATTDSGKPRFARFVAVRDYE